MSIINKMLQDLDKRHAAPDPDAPAQPGPSRLAQQVRPVAATQLPSMGSNLFWRIMAGVMVVAVVWVIWLMWQLTPRSVVTDLALRSIGKARVAASPPAAMPVPSPPAVPPVSVASAPAPVSVQPPPAAVQPAPAVVAPKPAPVVIPPPKPTPPPLAAKSVPVPPNAATTARPPEAKPVVDMLKLATEISAPIKSAAPKTQPRPPAKQTVPRIAKAEDVTHDTRAAKGSDRTASTAAKSATSAHAAQATLAVAPDAARIDKRVDATPRERAESGFRRAMSLVNQGRMAEGMDELKTALLADPSYEVARQTLVALLLEAKRTSEAAGLLRDGLAIDPANVPYAMLLARIHVERGDPHGALALLQKSEATARNNAEYQAFVAALYQRLGRHTEAVERYRVALRLSAGVGAWWVGLGISQEALSREKDATESFHRAKGTGSLSPELVAYVDRRLKQLR